MSVDSTSTSRESENAGDPELHHTGISGVRESLHAMSVQLKDGSRKINQYHLLKEIGQGSFARVHLGETNDEVRFYAIKEFEKRRMRRQRLMELRKQLQTLSKLDDENDPLNLVRTEVAIMKKLHHPNILRMYEALDEPDTDHLYLVYEYCHGGAVYPVKPGQTSTPLTEDQARHYFRQIMCGVAYLHSLGIAHRDIKPDNILLTHEKDECKISDFGVSEMFMKPSDDEVSDMVGTPAFMSPQLCTSRNVPSHGYTDDIWACGVTLYCFLMGRLPFDKPNILDLYAAIEHDEPVFDARLSEECLDLLHKMFIKDETQRITADDILEHPWLTQHGSNPIATPSELGASLDSLTDEDVQSAVCRISSMFTVARAVSKFKRASSRTSSSSNSGDGGGDASLPPETTPASAPAPDLPSDGKTTQSCPPDDKANSDEPHSLLDQQIVLSPTPTLNPITMPEVQKEMADVSPILASPANEQPVVCASPTSTSNGLSAP